MWARKKARENPDVPAGMTVTGTGFVLIGILVFALLAGLTAQFWASETAFGTWMSTGTGRLIFLVLTLGGAILAEYLLGLVGIRIIALRKRNDV
jgi:NAD(P)H-hydrate repair Nnr-like enzyme with NAD(P)H-hydrate dehydratase domain